MATRNKLIELGDESLENYIAISWEAEGPGGGGYDGLGIITNLEFVKKDGKYILTPKNLELLKICAPASAVAFRIGPHYSTSMPIPPYREKLYPVQYYRKRKAGE